MSDRSAALPVAIVTGAGSGIGGAIAARLAADGHPVAVLDRDGAAAQAQVQRIVAAGGRALPVVCDVARAEEVDAAVASAVDLLGPPGRLVNAAGIAIRKGLLDTTPQEWRTVIGTNLDGYFHLLRAVVPPMRDAGGGSIVQIASIAAYLGYGYPSYTASKGAVLAITRQLAKELAPMRIRINSISPGVIETGLNRDSLGNDQVRAMTVGVTPLGRLGEASEVASLAAFLLGEEAGYITGADVVVDGGMTTHINFGKDSDIITGFHSKDAQAGPPAGAATGRGAQR